MDAAGQVDGQLTVGLIKRVYYYGMEMSLMAGV